LSKYGLCEKEIAKILSVTQAAISKYRSNKYSDNVKHLETSIGKDIVERYAAKILENIHRDTGIAESYANAYICTVCKKMNDFGCSIASKEMI
jgi:predicted transcriptional regulator